MEKRSSFLVSDELPPIVPTSDEKTLALLSHVTTFVSPFLAPLIIYLIKKDESTFVATHAKESLNFQITFLIVAIICLVTVIGWLFLLIIGIYVLVLVIIATIKASEGKLFRYPFTIRFIK